jgi:hypothetical protein
VVKIAGKNSQSSETTFCVKFRSVACHGCSDFPKMAVFPFHDQMQIHIRHDEWSFLPYYGSSQHFREPKYIPLDVSSLVGACKASRSSGKNGATENVIPVLSLWTKEPLWRLAMAHASPK